MKRLFPILCVSLAFAGVAAATPAPSGPAPAAEAVPSAAKPTAPGRKGTAGIVKRLRHWKPGVVAARRYARRRAGHVSFQIDLGRRRPGLDEGYRAQAASTFKVMLLASYLRRKKVRQRRLGSHDRELLGPMIRRSDNTAASLVRNIVGRGGIERLARRAHMRDFAYSPIWGASLTSARDQARFLRNLRRFVPKRHWPYASRLLRTIVRSQSWGIGRVKPRGWRVHFKGGWGDLSGGYGGLDHQVALLTRGRARFGLAIVTTGNPTLGYGNQTLQGVARRLLRGLPR